MKWTNTGIAQKNSWLKEKTIHLAVDNNQELYKNR